MLKILLIAGALVALATSSWGADFHKVFTGTILPHEGEYTTASNDPGNWTGGKVGKGKLNGTKYGIAAASFPKLDIKNLTIAQAEAIYRRDYWDAYHLGELKSQGISEELCDEIVNGGLGMGRNLLFKVYDELCWTGASPPPAAFNKTNIAWINQFTAVRDQRVAFYNSVRIKRVKYYVTLVEKRPKMRPYFLSWISRSVD